MTMPLSAKSSSTVTLEECVRDARLSMECLTLRRKSNETKNEREIAQERFAEVQSHYNARIENASNNFNNLILGDDLLDYIRIVKEQYHHPPNLSVLQKHAELLRYVRNQELLETYIRIMEKQHKETIHRMVKIRMNMVVGLMAQKEKVASIRKNLFYVATKRVELYCKQKVKRIPRRRCLFNSAA